MFMVYAQGLDNESSRSNDLKIHGVKMPTNWNQTMGCRYGKLAMVWSIGDEA